MRDITWESCPICAEAVQVPSDDQLHVPLFVATCGHCGLEFDWRLSNKQFLSGAKLHCEDYLAPSETWDHDHCAMCWHKFMEEDYPDVEHAGYVTYTSGAKWWICRQCFDDLHEEMQWRLESELQQTPD